jgi:hypothetical protein
MVSNEKDMTNDLVSIIMLSILLGKMSVFTWSSESR